MKKAKARAERTRPRRVSRGRAARKPADLNAIRQQITNLVGGQALSMVNDTIEEVGKGHYLAMKYLFEMIGLFPANGHEESPVEDSLAKTLMRRLGLPEEPKLETEVTKDQVAETFPPTDDAVK
jgi:hypothetical protein